MNTSKLQKLLSGLIATPLLAGVVSGQTLKDPVPVGALNISAEVHFGATAIQYPLAAKDLVDINSNGQLLTKKRVRLRVRVVGVGLQSGSTELPVGLWIQAGTDQHRLLYYADSEALDAEAYLIDRIFEPNRVINFAARGQGASGAWGVIRTTKSADVSLTTHVDGEFAASPSQEVIKSFLTQHITSDSLVALGSREILYLFELETRDPALRNFDMQDLVMIVTLEEAK